jgi:putative ABC transport system permease protein
MIRQRILQHNASLSGNLRVVPVAFAIATAADGSRVVVGGTDVPAFRELNSWWSVHAENGAGTYVLLGSQAARILSPSGRAFPIAFGSRQITLHPEIVFNSGSVDDSRIYIDLKEFVALTGAQANTALLRIEARPQEIQDAITALTASFPELEIKPVRQITEAQTAVVGRTRSLVLTASIVIVGLVLLCMLATLTSSVLERRKDFAVMKALGASNGAVGFLFVAESALLALAGAIAGFAVGSGLAYWIGKVNFDAAILPQPALLLPVLLGSVTIALLAATVPLERLRRIQPAGILRGE